MVRRLGCLALVPSILPFVLACQPVEKERPAHGHPLVAQGDDIDLAKGAYRLTLDATTEADEAGGCSGAPVELLWIGELADATLRTASGEAFDVVLENDQRVDIGAIDMGYLLVDGVCTGSGELEVWGARGEGGFSIVFAAGEQPIESWVYAERLP